MPNVTLKYDVDPDSLFKFIVNPDEIKHRCEAFGETNVSVDVSESGGTTIATCTRDVEQDLPSFAKKIFKPKNTIVERKEWRKDGERFVCTMHIDVRGAPTHIDGAITIAPSAGGCTYSVDYQPKVKVPLIGKKIEAFISGVTAEQIQREFEHNRGVLGRG